MCAAKKISERSSVGQTQRSKTVKPRKIGVMNPYALLKLLKPLITPPITPLFKEKVDLYKPVNLALMYAHFSKNEQMPEGWSEKDLAKNLFNPKLSPLYKPLKGIHVLYKIPKDYLTGSEGIFKRSSGAGASSPVHTNPPDRYSNFTIPYMNKPTNNAWDIIGDITQGAAVDCYFHAALYSRVWRQYPTFPQNMITKIYFRNDAQHPTTVTASFPVDTGGSPVFTQPSANGCMWPMAWEKGYAEFRGLLMSSLNNAQRGNFPNPAYDPEIGAFSYYDPMAALGEITGKVYHPNSTTDTASPTLFDTASPGTDCYNKLTTCNNTTNQNIVGTNNSTTTVYPTVAWTKDTCPAFPPILVAKHSYSVLGTFSPDNGTTKYIILRNPWGVQFGPGDPAFTTLQPYLSTGNYQPSNLSHPQSLGPISTLGIFGLATTVFNTYFAGFGWVV
jgi:hypothetical protein